MNENNQINQKTTVRAVERAIDILNCFIDTKELGLTEIATRIHLHKSTVHRIIYTLETKGFLMKNTETEKYRLGFRIWELSSNLMGMDDPATLFLPEMQLLRDSLGETISLYVRDGYERIRIQAVESKQAIRRVAPIGVRLPLTVGASSKVLIAFEDANTIERLLEQLHTLYGIDKNAFHRMINEVKEKGYATSFEEREIGAAAVSCPIYNKNHRIISALTVSGPVNRLSNKRIEEISLTLKEKTIKMSKIMTK